MIFRKAVEKDYIQVKKLYADFSKQWLYVSEEKNEMTEDEAKEKLYELGVSEELLKQVTQEYESYSYEDFCRDLKQRDKLYYVFGANKNGKNTILGYIIFSKRSIYQVDQNNEPLWDEEKIKSLSIIEWGIEKVNLLPRMGMLLKAKFPEYELQAFPSKRWCKQMFEFIQSNQCGP